MGWHELQSYLRGWHFIAINVAVKLATDEFDASDIVLYAVKIFFDLNRTLSLGVVQKRTNEHLFFAVGE